MIIKNLTIKTLKERVLIEDLSFTLNKGDKMAIIGEEGNGKSTLIKWLINDDSVKEYSTYTGTIDRENQKIGYLPQFIKEEWNTQTVSDFLLKETPNSDIPWEMYNELEQYVTLITKMGLKKDIIEKEQLIKTLSGGEKIKLQLVKIMLSKPDIYILDEPTNDLDIDTLEWLEDFMLGIDEPILFISHDEFLLKAVANRILHLEQLKRKQAPIHTIENISYEEYVEKRGYLVARQNKIAEKEKALHQKQMNRWRQIYQKVDHDLNAVSRQDPHTGQLLKKKMKNVQSVKERLDKKELTERRETEEAIDIFLDSSITIPMNKVILDYHLNELKIENQLLAKDINLFVKGPEKVIIVGNNGSGKSTFFHLLVEHMKNNSTMKVGVMPQDYRTIIDNQIKPFEFIAESSKKEDITEARLLLGRLKLTSQEMEKPMVELSGGQIAKIILAKFIYDKSEVLLLDEPTRNLSPLSNPVIRKMLEEFNGAIIAISHDRAFIEEVADIVYELTTTGLIEMRKQ